MQKFKKFMAVALAATMVVGSSATAFAAEPATSGTTEGAGTSEGHVDRHTVKVTLPTVADGSTPFAYTMDLERLIQETTNSKYSGATFPAAASDTGVYFLTAANTYANESQKLTVTSESSADVKLKVDVEAVSAATDVALVNTTPAASVTDPQLYLALKVGSEAAVPVEADKTISKEVTIAGVPGNFETTWDSTSSTYKYTPKSGATGWGTTTFSIAGAASKAASAEGLTAPTLKVTWSWTDPAANAAPSIATTTYTLTAGTALDIPVDLGKGNLAATAVDSVTLSGVDYEYISAADYVVYDSAAKKVTLTAAMVDACKSGNLSRLNISFNDTANTTIAVSLN